MRKAKFPTQADFAQAIGMSLRGYQKYEQGESQPTPDTLDDFARHLDCEPIDLIVDSRIQKKSSNPTIGDAVELLKAYEMATPEIRAFAMTILTGDRSYADAYPRLIELLDSRSKLPISR